MDSAIIPSTFKRLVLFVFFLTSLYAQGPGRVIIASNSSWDVFPSWPSAGIDSKGKALPVCVPANPRPPCPAGSLSFANQPVGSWPVNLASLQSSSDPAERAQWIWAAGTPIRIPQGMYFQRKYFVNGTPTNAKLYLAVDDFAEVYVNGIRVGDYGSLTSIDAAITAQSALKEFDITSVVVSGVNTITVHATDSGNFTGCTQCRLTQYSSGLVVGGFIDYAGLTTAIPPVLLGMPGVPANQSGSVGLYGVVPGNYDTQPGINSLRPPRRVYSTSMPVSYVNTNTGNHVLQYRDYIYSGEGLRFAFVRFYNSLDPYSGPLGKGWTHSYNVFLTQDALGRITVKLADGREVLYAPSPTGSGYDALTPGVFEVLTRDSSGFTLTRPNRNMLKFSPAGKLTAILTENGESMQMFYDSVGNLIRVQDPAQRNFLLSYEGTLLKTIKDSFGKTLASYEFDSVPRLIAFTDIFGKRTQYVYNSAGQLVEALQPNGVTTFHNTFDSAGRVIAQVNGSGVQTSFLYSIPAAPPPTSFDAVGPASTFYTLVTDPLGRVTRHDFDSARRLISITLDYGDSTRINATTLFTYDLGNNRASMTDPNGNVTRYSYNGRGSILSSTDPLGRATRYTYDAANRLISMTDPRGSIRRFTYNSAGLRETETDNEGKLTRYTYTAAGDVATVTDANARQTFYTYDSARNLVQVRDANNNIADFSYDGRGNRTKSVQQGLTTTHIYDELNRLVTVIFPGAGTVPSTSQSYTYDAMGNVIKFVSRRGLLTTMQYDASNRLLNVSYADEKRVVYTYDAVGNRLQMTDSRGSTSYTYDALNRMTRTVRNTTGAARPVQTVSYTYDKAGNRTRVVYPDEKSMTYQYDADNRISAATDWQSRTTTYTYDPNGNPLVVSTPPILTSTLTFDRNDRVKSVQNSFNYGTDPDSAAISSYVYQLDNIGNRLSVQDGSGDTTAYSYDALYELTSVTNRSGVARYQYDATGNRTSAQEAGATAPVLSTYANNLLVQSGATTFTNDAEGNRISATGPLGTIQYTYDAASRLTTVSGPGSAVTTYAYDGDGNRIEQIVNGDLHEYTNDVAAPLVVVLQELVRPARATGFTITSYAWGRALISSSSPAGDNFYVYDGLGSVVGILGTDGRLKQRYVYDAWGQTTVIRAPGDSGIYNPFRFTGEMQDPANALYYLRARYYDPATARFLTADNYFAYPRLPLSLNRYAYVRNNPVRYIDRTGRDPEDEYYAEPQEVAWEEPVWTDAWEDSGWPFSPPWP